MTEPVQSTDPGVLRRRKYQEAAAKWLAKWSYPLQAIFAATGFSVVLLPMFSKNWRSAIESTPVAAQIFREFSNLSGWPIVLLFVLLALLSFMNLNVNDYPGGWHPTRQWGFPSPKQTVALELYPTTRAEERVFWVNFVLGTIGTSFWLLGFGACAFFLKPGG